MAASPSVTQVIKAAGMYDAWITRSDGYGEGLPGGGAVGESMRRARDRGRAVHRACELDDTGRLDESTVHEEVQPRLDAYRRFKREHGAVEWIEHEVRRAHPWLLYTGKPDLIAWLHARRSVVDFKATDEPLDPTTIVQLCGYFMLWNATHPSEQLSEAHALHLRSNGRYWFRTLDAADMEEGSQMFLAALRLWHWRNEHARLPEAA